MTVLNPYKVLGIRRDSGAKRIKKAFREAAKRVHPDIGGSAEAFNEVRRAYFILSDPERRRKYDTTGQIDEVSALGFENQVAAVLIQLFDTYIRSGKAFKRDLDVIEAMRNTVRTKIDDHKRQIAEDGELVRPLAALKLRISRREGDNLFGNVLERRIAQLHEHAAAIRDQVSVLNAARAELESYDCVTEMVQHHRLFAFSFSTESATSTAGAY